VRHRFVNDGLVPIPMGPTAEYACVCGRRGTRAAIERHLAESDGVVVRHDTTPGIGDEDFGGNTKAHYLPIEPRVPAPSTFNNAETSAPELPPPPRRSEEACPICQAGLPIADLPEIGAWSCGHWVHKKPRPIAEAFQEMLRTAYQAGGAAATGETFESWYEREVLH
jgi:hypothetical protein